MTLITFICYGYHGMIIPHCNQVNLPAKKNETKKLCPYCRKFTNNKS